MKSNTAKGETCLHFKWKTAVKLRVRVKTLMSFSLQSQYKFYKYNSKLFQDPLMQNNTKTRQTTRIAATNHKNKNYLGDRLTHFLDHFQ